MPHHAVERKVTPCLRIECQFWLGDDRLERQSFRAFDFRLLGKGSVLVNPILSKPAIHQPFAALDISKNGVQ